MKIQVNILMHAAFGSTRHESRMEVHGQKGAVSRRHIHVSNYYAGYCRQQPVWYARKALAWSGSWEKQLQISEDLHKELYSSLSTPCVIAS
jgi:hypothetical protein